MKVILLDGYNLMHRARFGMKMGDSHIVFNFFRGLRPIVEETRPDKMYLVLEGYPAHRIAADSAYKANRVIEPGTPKAAGRRPRDAPAVDHAFGPAPYALCGCCRPVPRHPVPVE